MQRNRYIVLVAVLFFLSPPFGCREQAASQRLDLAAISTGETITGERAAEALRKARLVLVGEQHTNDDHHAAQLRVVRFLDQQSVPTAIGLEMFRKNQQAVLDRWVNGTIDEKAFEAIYLDNWNYPWRHYRDIFLYARDNRIPMVGLNVPRDITRQVAREGFSSLTEDQRGELDMVTCNVTRAYRDYLRSTLAAHGHGKMEFIRFCEAQLVWDTAMAVHALGYLEQHPQRVMVLLTGSVHARKMGIPFQFKSRSAIPFVVLLPHTPGFFDTEHLTTADADYIILP